MDVNNHNYISDEDLAAFLDGNANADEASRILELLPFDQEAAEIVALSDKIDLECDRLCSVSILPMRALAAANPENLCSFECEIFILRKLGFDVDHWSLLETAKANNWINEGGTPLHHVGRLLELKGVAVERTYDASIASIRQAIEQGKKVIIVADKNGLTPSDNDAVNFHAAVIAEVSESGNLRIVNPADDTFEEIDANQFVKAWASTSHYMVTASSNALVYNPQPIDVSCIDLDSDLEELTEAIAENAHDIWARARMDEGWTYGSVRDDARKQHPDLVPYAQLPESEKHYDRIMAMNTLRLVRRLGYDIINRG